MTHAIEMIKQIVFLVAFSVHFAFGQIIENPSFEGPKGASVTPPGWSPCNEFSTPDTQPGAWNVTTPPSHGTSYLSLVTRGTDDEKYNTKEALYTTLKKPLRAGVTYGISIDLAYAADFDDLWYYPDWQPIQLKIFVGVSRCDKKTLIWESPVISNVNWVTHHFDYTGEEDMSIILLEAEFANGIIYNGNILVDNIVIDDPFSSPPNKLPESKGCRLRTPNVFTPNADHINDNFVIEHSIDIQRYHIKIYDRWGQLAFESFQIDNVWDGRTRSGELAPSGVYYWTISCLCIEANSIREDNLKGIVTLLH